MIVHDVTEVKALFKLKRDLLYFFFRFARGHKRNNKKPVFSKLDERKLFDLLNALFPGTSVYVYQSDGSTVTDSFMFHEKVYDAETMTWQHRDKDENYGGWGPNKEATRTGSFALTIPNKKYVEALVELSAAGGNTELTALLLELTRKLREGFEDNAASFLIEGNVLKKYRGLGSKVIVPESVTSIGRSAFEDCTSLTDITLPDGVTSIDKLTFSGCKNLTGVTLPEGLTSIGDKAFEGCKSLTSITLPDSVTSIGNEAFEGCAKLKKITLPDRLTSIGDGAFRGCKGLADKQGMVIIRGVLYSYHGSGGDVAVPDSVTSIGNSAFSACASLTGITLPEDVTSIGKEAFRGCKGLADEQGMVIVRGVLYSYHGSGGDVTVPDIL